MGILDQITQMKNQGQTEQDIIYALQQQGISPRDIQDALSQAQIKNAVIGVPDEEMQQSIMDQPDTEEQEMFENQSFYPQQPAETMPQEPQYQENYPQEYFPQYSPQENYAQEYPPQEYSQQYSPQENYESSPGLMDTNNLIEISEQVFAEKMKKIQKLLDSLTEFKTLTDIKLKGMEDRLKRIESIIDQLQISILDKIGSYGQNLDSIKKEMSMMQDSFGKIINPFLDKYKK